jgi:tRNA-2-methylthio-N6-dimethylallyladenosine synthase
VIIGVTGCVAQQEGERLLDRVPYLDLVIGTQAIPSLPELVQIVGVSSQRICETGFDPSGKYLETRLPQGPLTQVKSNVTIMQGCDHFCSYCIVPYVRGRERSRSSSDIVGEVRHLAEMGIREVCLLGQNVNSYGKGLEGECDFPDLLERIQDIEGIWRIRFITSHPEDFSERLIQSFSKLSKLCEQIHLPFQSGSDRILERMNRGYTKADCLRKIARLKEGCSAIAVSTDVIVGFPGEDEQDFEETLNLIRRVRFDDLFSFKYSPRKGTRAAQFVDQVDAKVKQDRLAQIQDIQNGITLEKNHGLEGSIQEVLVEGSSKLFDRDVKGRTRSNKIVNFEGNLSFVGKLIPVLITKAYAHSLRGELVKSKM